MPSLEEMLAAIAAEDGDQETVSDDTNDAPKAQQSSAFKQLRDHAKKLEREAAAAAKERDELRAWKESRVQEDNSNALKGAGLSPRQADVFLKFYGDVTPENIAEFRRDVLGAEVEETAPPEEEFRPTGAVSAFGQEEKPLSKAEFEALWAKDPAKARAVAAAGRVQFRQG